MGDKVRSWDSIKEMVYWRTGVSTLGIQNFTVNELRAHKAVGINNEDLQIFNVRWMQKYLYIMCLLWVKHNIIPLHYMHK